MGTPMHDRRRFLVGSLAVLAGATARSAPALQDTNDLNELGTFERVLGRPGIVVGVPHGTADAGTLSAGRIICSRLNAGGVFVTGFWDVKTRQRINVNRATEELVGPNSQVLREWPSPRAVAANARYDALVKEAAQGPIRAFYEIHSNHRPEYAESIEVSTLGVWRGEARRLKDAFAAAVARLAPDVPRLAMHVSPLDRVTYPNYAYASSISRLSAKGCAIESPGHVFSRPAWRDAYASCLADAMMATKWG